MMIGSNIATILHCTQFWGVVTIAEDIPAIKIRHYGRKRKRATENKCEITKVTCCLLV